jgi:hypothetical protein
VTPESLPLQLPPGLLLQIGTRSDQLPELANDFESIPIPSNNELVSPLSIAIDKDVPLVGSHVYSDGVFFAHYSYALDLGLELRE